MRASRSRILLLIALPLCAQQPDRIVAPIDPSRTVRLRGHVHPRAQPQYDQGPAAAAMPLDDVTLFLTPAPSLETFLAEQQIPGSPNYHRWLTPEQFGDRFGLSRNDNAKVVSWLQSQGLKVNSVARGRHWITFSGTAAVVGRALGTEIHRYRVNGETHFANATTPAIPAALEGVIGGFNGLDDFKPKSMVRRAAPENNMGSSHALAPDDFAVIYNVGPLYSAGVDGTGQKIVIVGDTALDVTDIQAFRKRYNLAANDPQVVLFGSDPGINGDLLEADLDIEWAGAVARNATVVYVYARSVNNAAQYAIDQNLAPVMSMSFGGCELAASTAFRAVAQQASAQGITWFAASGDQGVATCDSFDPTPETNFGPTASFPASIPEITAVGGTEFTDGTTNFWTSTNSANGASARSYVPEQAWNDSRLSATGGGPSALFPKPLWQTGPGVPADNARDLPDVSLAASPARYPYLVISGGLLAGVGGTSASSPTFAGIAALLNQYLVSNGALAQPGLGNMNPALYRLAQGTTDVFHDATAGDNKSICEQSSPGCVNGLVGYSAGAGYDMATGLGSVDAYNLVTEWTAGASSTTTLTANPGSFNLSDTVQLTATVAGSGRTSPTGAVAFLANDSLLGTVALSGSSATMTVSATLIAGTNGSVTAVYSGDGAYGSSAGSAQVNVSLPASGSFAVPVVTPNPGYQSAIGNWPLVVTLNEKAGVATTLTGFTINGNSQDLSLWSTTKLPANGSISRSFSISGFTPPNSRVFAFNGIDADGKTWTRQLTVNFLPPVGPPFLPSISLTSAQPVVPQNPQADPSCQWSQQVTVQEKAGFYMDLTQFTAPGADFTKQIQQLFGTTRLAPYAMLQANVCWSNIAAPTTKTYMMTATSEGPIIATISSSLLATFQPPAANPAALSASPQTVTFSASGSATVDLTAGATWTASVSTAHSATQWLAVSPLSGTGSARLTLQASASGLSNGVYNTVIAIQSPSAIPQIVNVQVTLVVGASDTTSIQGLQNSFSFQSAFAPGMVMSVYGTALSPSTRSATTRPLPLTVVGVSATVNGIAAPLYYVSPGQINLQIPYETGAGPAVLGINNNGQIASYPFTVSVTAPGLYTSAIDLTGNAAASGQQGQTMLLFMTGEGDVTPTLATGATPSAKTPVAKLPQARLGVTVTVGGVPADVAFAGIPNGLVGVTQIDFTVPPNAPPGMQPVVVTVGGVAAPPVNLNVTALTSASQ